MLKQYSLKMPSRVFGGNGSLTEMENIVRGRRIAVFTDKGIEKSGLLDIPLSIAGKAGAQSIILDELPTEPDYMQAQETIGLFRETGAELIVAIGGGSVMDIAKLASIAATDDYTVKDMLDQPLLGKKQIETLLIPTTAGTGSEATPNSIVAVPEKELKVGIVNPEMLADSVILDSSMIKKLPLKIAAATGIDALAHAIECFTSNKANPFSNLFAMEALKLIFGNIERACMDPEAIQEKDNMLMAAFYGGVAITSSGTTGVHALSYPLGGKYHIAHGVSNAMLLLPVMHFNKDACLDEFEQIYDAVMPAASGAIGKEEKAEAVLERMEQIIRCLEIPSSLSEFRIRENDLGTLVEAGMQVTRLLENNRKKITPEDARKIYQKIL
ncbi:MAG TPA: iron-containing alcohol dehydrogenase [Candidatus Eisenbergiella merdavium]|uniref:Iron-containing alcohol dehydrogenase n=1 Tax=Candidatus Eisenbergiella merdavium TaxID=2838551 RepID=A0A9D2NFI6_9FIRM|nr:iron-containing alcohol dehydrogenase [Candidatus Eisenbergiella merdavium]